MAGKSFVPNPNSKGHNIERRRFYERSSDFQQTCKAVPFVIGVEPTAVSWWHRSAGAEGRSMLCVGEPVKTDRIITAPISSSRQFVPGDKPDSLIECRVYNAEHFKNEMLKVVPPNPIPGLSPVAWWEVQDAANPGEGPADLCIGLRPVASAAAVKVAGDGLEAMPKAKLLTEAGKMGLRDVNDSMQEGEIIQRIREKKAKKAEKREAVGA